MAALTTPTAVFVLIAATAASAYSLTASARYLGDRLEQLASESVVVRPGAMRNYSVAAIANLPPGSISAVAPLPKSGPSGPAQGGRCGGDAGDGLGSCGGPRARSSASTSPGSTCAAPPTRGRKVGVVRGGQNSPRLPKSTAGCASRPGVSGWVHTKYLVAME